MKKLTIPAKTEYLDQVLAFVEDLLRSVGCSEQDIVQIDIAVEEVYVNIAHYAYPPREGEADICCGILDENTLFIELSDRGKPYDPLSRKDPDITLSADERQIGGLGIFMVKNIMDSVSYRFEDGQNKLTMKKVLEI